jgi:hypothetical protein
MLCTFQADHPPIIRSSKTVHRASGFFKLILLPAAIVEELEHQFQLFHDICSSSSTIAACSSKNLKKPDALCTVFELLMMGGGFA